MGSCPNCGKPTDEDSKFCRNCGGKIEPGQEAPTINASGERDANLPPTTNRIKKPVVIGIVAALLVAIAFGGCSLLGGGGKPVVSNTTESGVNSPPGGSAQPEVGDTIESGDNSSPGGDAQSEVGDIIEFGGYEWRVLEVRGNRALILSENILEWKTYQTDGKSVTWETCDLRHYLNDDFYNSFTTAERNRIEETRITNSDNPWYGTSGGSDTNDMVFLLSLDEVVRYFGDSGELRSGGSNSYRISDQYDSARIAYIHSDWDGWSDIGSSRGNWEDYLETHGGALSWWLRTPGYYSYNAVSVVDDGSVDVAGNGEVYYTYHGIRPALWLNL